jgi:hypothetical protein
VEVQVDGGPWLPATLDRGEAAEFAWEMWQVDWDQPSSGEHTIVSRAINTQGNIQPEMDDPRIAKKRTKWESNEQFVRRIQSLPTTPGLSHPHIQPGVGRKSALP